MHNMLQGLLSWSTIASLLFATIPASSASVVYRLDGLGTDTTPEEWLPTGLVPTNPQYTGSIVGDLMWLNSYRVQAGGNVLQSISLAWGAPGAWAGQTGLSDWQTTPYPVSLLLYGDPNNDGRPDDAQLLMQAETTVQNPDTFSLTTVSIPSIRLPVGSQFFVAALFRNQRRGQLPATIDTANPTPGRSWFVIANHGDDSPSNFNVLNLGQNYVPPTLLGDQAGNWVLRVTGESEPPPREIPEGGSLGGLWVFFGWMLLHRRRWMLSRRDVRSPRSAPRSL